MGKIPFTQPLAVLAFTLFLVIVSLGQGTTSRVTGVVTDNTGAAVSGATVTLTNAGTNSSQTTQTSESGAYTFDLIQPGTYTVTVEKSGFKRYISTKNAALVNQPTTVNAALEIGDVSAAVTVTGSAEQVQTSTSGNIGSTIDQRTLESLPIVGLRGRNPLDLLNFQPGVVFGGNTGGAVNVNGSRDRAFNFTLDGIDINDSTAGGSNFTPLRPNPDSVQEFQIVTSNFTAELGRSSGAQVTFVTRSGTNQFHGNLFEYYQTPRFNAKSYPVTIAKTPKEQFVQHIFGGSLGGPVPTFGMGEGSSPWFLRDKAFFFVNLQMLRAYDTALVTRTVYTQAARQGLFRYVQGREVVNGSTVTYQNNPAGSSDPSVDAAGNPIRPVCTATLTIHCMNTYNAITNSPFSFDPTLQGFLNSMPLPNNFTVGDGLNTAGFDWASPQHERQYDFVTRVDYKLNDKNAFYGRYAIGEQDSHGDSANSGRPIFPDSGNFVDTSRGPKNFALNYRWSPTSTFSNEFVFGVSKYFFSFATPNPDPAWPFTFVNAATPKLNFSYNARGVKTWQFIDNATWVKGSHTFKGGINFRFATHTDDRSNVGGTQIEPLVNFARTNFNFVTPNNFHLPAASSATNPTGISSNDLTRLQNTLVDYLGIVSSISQAYVVDPSDPSKFAPAGTRWINKAHYDEYDFYFQDNWRFRQNLVFDLGVRWEPKLSPSVDDRPILVPNQPVKLGAAPSNTLKWQEGKLFDNDFSKILPSVGFAWDPFKSGKTSIRANYRLASDRFATFLFGSFIFQNALGNTTGPSRSLTNFLYRNVAGEFATLAPTTTPTAARQPAALGSLTTNVIDPDLQFPQIHEWSLSFQRELFKNNVFEFNYIGKHGVHLLGLYNANQVNIFAADPRCGGQTFLQAFNQARDTTNTAANCLASLLVGGTVTGDSTAFRSQFGGSNSSDLALGNIGAVAAILARRSGSTSLTTNNFSPFFFMPYPQFAGTGNQGLNVYDSNDYSHYNGLQFIFKRRIQNGLGFQFGYTWSKSKDNRSWDPSLSAISTTNSVQSNSSTPFDLRDRNVNYAWSDFDRRHVFQGTYVYELPFGKGKWLDGNNKAVNYIIGDWQFAGTVIWMSGRPFTVYSGATTFGNVVQSTADCSGCTRDIGSLVLESGKNFWFDSATRALFSAPAPGSTGNTGRNFFLAPPYFQTDISALKKFRINEKWSFDLRLDVRNLTNTPSFDNPTAVVTSSIFGRINDSVTNNARRMQVSGKLNF